MELWLFCYPGRTQKFIIILVYLTQPSRVVKDRVCSTFTGYILKFPLGWLHCPRPFKKVWIGGELSLYVLLKSRLWLAFTGRNHFPSSVFEVVNYPSTILSNRKTWNSCTGFAGSLHSCTHKHLSLSLFFFFSKVDLRLLRTTVFCSLYQSHLKEEEVIAQDFFPSKILHFIWLIS